MGNIVEIRTVNFDRSKIGEYFVLGVGVHNRQDLEHLFGINNLIKGVKEVNVTHSKNVNVLIDNQAQLHLGDDWSVSVPRGILVSRPLLIEMR